MPLKSLPKTVFLRVVLLAALLTLAMTQLPNTSFLTASATDGGVCEIQARNLANQAVAGVAVEVINATSGFSLNLRQETNRTGWAKFLLEAGNYTFKAFWKDVEVGALVNQSVTDNVLLPPLRCDRLSNLKITVREEKTSTPVPLVDLSLSYNYTTRYNNQTLETGSFSTSIDGTVLLENTFTNISYLIEARRYGFVFNETIVESLPAQAWNNITIIAPTYTMSIQVFDSQDDYAVGIEVEAYEWSSGISKPLQSKFTDFEGNATFSLTFGRYRLRLYEETTFLDEVAVDLTQNQSFVFQSNIYNVDLSVLVVDYFGQPIPNVLVDFKRRVNSNYETVQTEITASDGVAWFSVITGGDCLVYVSVAGRPRETQYLSLVGPSRDIVVKMDGYVAVVGLALETSHFVTIILLLIMIVSFILASTYKKLPSLLQRQRK